MRFPLRQIMVGLLINFATQAALAIGENNGATTTQYPADVVPKGMQRYVIPMQGCAIEFFARKGGHTRSYAGSSGLYGSFSHSNMPGSKRQKSLTLNISCYKGAAVDLCPKLLPVEDAENIRYYNIHRLEKLHPTYFGVAQISSFPLRGSRPGQVRELDFCLGDGSRTLQTDRGGVELGYDHRDISETAGKSLQRSSEIALPEVLEIIRSIRFVSTGGE